MALIFRMLERLFGRRRDRSKKPAPSLPVVDRPLHVADFFAFREVFFVRGWIEARSGEPIRMGLRLWDGTDVWCAHREDTFNRSSAMRQSFVFHHPLPPKVPAGDLAKIAVLAEVTDGLVVVTDPTKEGHAQDRFYSSEAGYWAMVADNPTANVLEIGSRARSGVSRRALFPPTCNYVGLDVVAGENVNVVCDAHRMSQVLPQDHFDFAFSVSTWEHLCMPWVVSLELNRVLKLGGVAMIATHQSWPSHEEPWDYFRFSEYSWDPLFNRHTGFEILERGVGIRCAMVPSLFREPVHKDQIEWHYGFLGSRCVVRKSGPSKLSWAVDPDEFGNGNYGY